MAPRPPLASLAGEEGVAAMRAQDAGTALELVTVGEDGWPHLALLSAGEVLPLADGRLALCLWRRSRTTHNVHRSGQALLQAVRPGEVLRLRLTARFVGALNVEGTDLDAFVATPVETTVDEAPYAAVLDGIRYRPHDRETVGARWQAQLAALGALVEADAAS